MYNIISMNEPGLFSVNTTTTAYIVHIGTKTVEEQQQTMLELCRAIVQIERSGAIVTSVQKIYPDGHRPRVAFRRLPEYKKAKMEPMPNIIDATYVSYWSSGAIFRAPCKVDLTTREILDVLSVGSAADDDDCNEECIVINDTHYDVVNLDELVELDGDIEEALQKIQNGGKAFWLSYEGNTPNKLQEMLDADDAETD